MSTQTNEPKINTPKKPTKFAKFVKWFCISTVGLLVLIIIIGITAPDETKPNSDKKSSSKIVLKTKIASKAKIPADVITKARVSSIPII